MRLIRPDQTGLTQPNGLTDLIHPTHLTYVPHPTYLPYLTHPTYLPIPPRLPTTSSASCRWLAARAWRWAVPISCER